MPAQSAELLRGPYLQQQTPDSIVIRWRTDTATDSRVRWGASPTALAATVDDPASTTEHEVQLTGLTPGATVLLFHRQQQRNPRGG